jgi:hypothetical protein
MTAQRPETIFIDGKAHLLLTLPLERRFKRRHRRPPFRAPTTACWRGYIGTWAIENSRLYLIKLEGNLCNGTRANLRTVFPDASGPVFADWFTGELRIPVGEMVRYVHMGFGSVFAAELMITVERGVVTGRVVRTAEPEEAPPQGTK